MYTAKLSSKGQIVVPKEVRDAHGWQPGDEFVIVEEQGGIQLRPVRSCRRLKASDLYGRL